MSTDDTVRTAVVFVHGLLERRPMDVLDSFAKVALTPSDGRWEYYPQPLEDTDSYEARRYTAPSEAAELFEYDWSFLMTSSRYAGFAAALATYPTRCSASGGRCGWRCSSRPPYS